jgi:hypothetical protein
LLGIAAAIVAAIVFLLVYLIALALEVRIDLNVRRSRLPARRRHAFAGRKRPVSRCFPA